MLNLQAHGIPLDASFRQVQFALQGPIPIHGCSAGCFNVITASTAAPRPYGQVNGGSGLIMTTELNSTGPISQGILTYSQASDPTSPWYENMKALLRAALGQAPLHSPAAQPRSPGPGADPERPMTRLIAPEARRDAFVFDVWR